MDYKDSPFLENFEELMRIGRMRESEDEEWKIYIKDTATHEFNAMWVAATLFLILDRYSNCIEDSEQLIFIKNVVKQFNLMLEEGHPYISKY